MDDLDSYLKIFEIWEIVKWMDDIRWNQENNIPLFEHEPFKKLCSSD